MIIVAGKGINDQFGWVGFNGISTIVGYLMPNPDIYIYIYTHTHTYTIYKHIL